jgi:hypothetical protein
MSNVVLRGEHTHHALAVAGVNSNILASEWIAEEQIISWLLRGSSRGNIIHHLEVPPQILANSRVGPDERLKATRATAAGGIEHPGCWHRTVRSICTLVSLLTMSFVREFLPGW